jgi:hypothetical protein
LRPALRSGVQKTSEFLPVVILRGSVPLFVTAMLTAMQDAEARSGIDHDADGIHDPAAVRRAISGLHIHVERGEAERAVVGVAVPVDAVTAVSAGEGFAHAAKLSLSRHASELRGLRLRGGGATLRA